MVAARATARSGSAPPPLSRVSSQPRTNPDDLEEAVFAADDAAAWQPPHEQRCAFDVAAAASPSAKPPSSRPVFTSPAPPLF